MKTLRRTAAALVAPLALAACNEPTPPPTPCRRRLSPPTRWNRPRRLRSSSRLDPRGPRAAGTATTCATMSGWTSLGRRTRT